MRQNATFPKVCAGRVLFDILACVRMGVLLCGLVLLTGCGGGGGGATSGGATPVPPTITSQPSSQTVTAGQTATFSVATTGSNPMSYQWQFNGATISGATLNTYSLANAQPSNAGSYSVVVSNSAGSAVSNSATLTVTTLVPPTITSQPSSQTVTAGQTATFSVVASGTTPLTYQWSKNGLAISGGTFASYTTPVTTASDSGSNFTVQVTNSGGTITSSAALLTVTPAQKPSINSFSVSPSTIGIGAGGILSWDVTGAISLSVDNGVGTLAGATGTVNVVPTASTTYTLTASSPAGTATATVTLTVDTTPFSISSLTATPGMTAFGGTSSLQWNYSGIPNILTLNSAPIVGTSTTVAPVRRQAYTLSGFNGLSGSNTSSKTVKVAAQGLDLLAGDTNGPGNLNGIGRDARFSSPNGVAVDTSGNVYVADTGNHTIRKITPAGVVTTLAGTAGMSGSTDGTGAAAKFYFPEGVTVDTSGNVYVADTGNHTIRKITPAGTVTTLAGTAGVYGSANGTGVAARFNRPSGLAVDGSGNVYVADTYNSSIRQITPAGIVTTLSGVFNYPKGVAVDSSGNLYVADTDNHTIRKITSTGILTTLAGSSGTSGSSDGTGTSARFYRPSGLAVDGSGNVYVADTGNHTIRRITPAGAVATVAGSPGLNGPNDGNGAAARFNFGSSRNSVR